MDIHHVIQRPLLTEKAMSAHEGQPRYSFAVHLKADKELIRRAIEGLFKVHVEKINTAIIRGKKRRVGRYTGKRPNWKKAVVTLKTGDKIELFEGV